MTPEKRLTLGVILPHTKIFGGVKRFFEIGNILISKGHRFTVFTPEGKAPDWFPFQGEVMALTHLSHHSFDALFITEPEYLDHLRDAKTALRIFYAVLQRRYIRKVAAEDDLIVFANSGSLYEYLRGDARANVVKCIGGIDAAKFQFRARAARKPTQPFVVLAYGRFYRRKKGTSLVVKACEKLYKNGYDLKLILFDAPVDDVARKKVEAFKCKLPFEFFMDYPVDQIADLYHKADLFVSAERNAGWSNTSAEAMACGVPVVATPSGTKDFLVHGETGLVVWRHPWFIQRAIKKLYNDEKLRSALSLNARKKIEGFSWKNLAENIEGYIARKCCNGK
jgi:glycosyltransferase involved in cell wall biosynthesis